MPYPLDAKGFAVLCEPTDFLWGDRCVADYPRDAHSRSAINRAGRALRGDLVWSAQTEADVRAVFDVANRWIESHAYPLGVIRAGMQGHMGALRLRGATGARIKRMASVREKLRRLTTKLSQLQDLGGCRGVVSSVTDVDRLVSQIKGSTRHTLIREVNYMTRPRESGYRSHHLIFAFKPRNREEEPFAGRHIEMQVRSRLQHSWATAVEAIGLYIGQDLKAGNGADDWLEFFRLMSKEFAAAEGQAVGAAHGKAVADLAGDLDAVRILQTLSHASSLLDIRPVAAGYAPSHCLLVYDHANRTVDVRYLSQPSAISAAYEQSIASEQDGSTTSVLVEYAKVSDLRDAFPNYFGDVQLFLSNLMRVISGTGAQDYTLPPVETVSRRQSTPDDAWLRRQGKGRWR